MFTTQKYIYQANTPGKPITINLRDDVNNSVSKLVGEQVQKQFDFFEQASAASGIDYKFTTRIEMLDGGNGASHSRHIRNLGTVWIICTLSQ
jgi:hypothetical protein